MKHYIDKDHIVTEIKERIDRNNESAASYSNNSEHDYFFRVEEKVYKSLLSFINHLEVKEVNSNDVFIDKACKLLARMIWEVTYEDLEGDSTQHYDKMEFIEDFKNYMKGE